MLTPRVLAPGRGRRYLSYACLGQHRVEGWLSKEATVLIDLCDALQREYDVRGGGAEIGIHHGRLFLLLRMLMREGETAVAMDVFEDQHLNADQSGHGDRAVFERNLRHCVGTTEGTRVVKVDSRTISGGDVQGWAGGPVRLFSIDGAHTAPITAKDLQTSAAALAEGGAVILDDVFNEAFPGVSEGLHAFLREPGHRLAPAVLTGNKTLLVDPEWVDRYQQRATQVLSRLGLVAQEHEFLGHRVIAFRQRPRGQKPAFWTQYWRGWARDRVRR